MPAKTPKQYGLMQAIKHGQSTALKGEKSGPTKAVAKEFIDKTPEAKKKKFAKALLKKR